MEKIFFRTKPKVVVIGGGTGVFTVLSGLRKFPLDLSAVVTMADDGGSTGILREEFGVLPPGDIRRALVALAHSDKRMLSDLFNYRFEEGGLKGHTFGNIMLTALERITGGFSNAVKEAAEILGVKGRVLPVTLDNVRLCAKLEDGTIIRGETNIDIPKHNANLRINSIFLEPSAAINKEAYDAILRADMMVIGPGDLYTSIVPNLVVEGARKAIRNSRAKKVYIVNLMTKHGETTGFPAAHFIGAIEKYVGRGVLTHALINTKRPSPERLRKYEQESARFVEAGDLSEKPVPIFGDFLRKSGYVRHDSDRLAGVLVSLL